MKPPRLPSPFRNVRQAPRNFQFRSSHVDQRALKWKERKERLEEEVQGSEQDGAPRKLRFRQEGVGRIDREGRLASLRRSRRQAMLRSALIMAVLLYAAWRGLLWVETTDFAREFQLTP